MLVTIILTNTALAAKVGVVVEFKNGDVYKECIDAVENTDGYDLLQKTKLSILWSPQSAFGQLICKINGEGTNVQGNFCEFFGEFWNFNIAKNNDWAHSPVGHNGPGGCWNRNENSFVGHYCTREGDVLGYKFTDSGAPPFISFDDICNTKTRLGVTSAKAFVNGKRKSGIDEKGGTIEAKPGSAIKLEVEVSNKYSENDKTEIEDIIVEGVLDLSSDVRDESSEFNLDANDERQVTLNFKLPENEPEGEYNLEINVEGKDKNDNKYETDVDFDVDVEKESHKVTFNDLSLMPSVLDCNANPLLTVELANSGDNDESGILTIKNNDFGIDVSAPFSIAKDSVFKKSYKLSIDNAQSGTYPLEISAVYNNGQKTEKNSANVVVKCSESASTKTSFKSSNANNNNKNAKIQSTPATSLAVKEEPFIMKYKTPIIIVGAEVVLLVFGVVFLVNSLRK
ncbi:hypothetical protein HYX02_05370 [Candidatus Woesearchaeota archaeon]|nr:hypothetical protein [Candidatus Woesearchaeota archaeon]